ncbi:MAG: DUF1232 domain-containing protein [Thermoguttaceae bacterium]|nr:DUF1232 domain-containing protein [Thermoguttaceae bacterium]
MSDARGAFPFKGRLASMRERARRADETGDALNAEARRRATEIFDAKKREAETVVANPDEARTVVAKWSGWLEKFGGASGVFDGVKTAFRALEATLSGEYRGFSPKAVAALAAAALYCVAPVDAIFDGIPGLGLCDDLFVVAATLKTLASEIRAFRTWERAKAARAVWGVRAKRLAAIERVVLCPGWLTAEASGDEIVEILRPIFPNAAFDFYRWPSNVDWATARDRVDGPVVGEFAKFASTLTIAPERTALIGHSLGARLAVRALARRARESAAPFGAAFLFGAAIDADDPEIAEAARAVDAPLGNFCAASDRVLKYAYRTVEAKRPLGLRGSERKWANYVDCEVSGDEEYWIEIGENVASAISLLGSKTLWAKFSVASETASKATEASRHRFALYASFFRDVFK